MRTVALKDMCFKAVNGDFASSAALSLTCLMNHNYWVLAWIAIYVRRSVRVGPISTTSDNIRPTSYDRNFHALSLWRNPKRLDAVELGLHRHTLIYYENLGKSTI